MRNFETWHSQAFSLLRRGQNFYAASIKEQQSWIAFCSELETIIPQKSNKDN